MNKPIKILMVRGVSEDAAQKTGWVWADRQADSLRALGCEIDTFGFANRRSFVGLWKSGMALRKKIHSFVPDVIHVHFAAAQGLVTVLFSSKPVIISFCGSDLLGNYDSTGRKTWSGYLSIVLSQLSAWGASRCIAKTAELKQALWFSAWQEKCEVIPNGVSFEQFVMTPRSQARVALGWGHNDPVVLFMNRQGAWVKNPELARCAFEMAKNKLPALQMYVVENEPPERMPLLLSAADALLITSRHEGSNNTVKEALACNLPVVSSPVGDIPERLKGVHPSMVVQPEPHAMAEALVAILRKLSRSNGREKILHLSLEGVARQVLATYGRALQKDT
jgi:teichuronic acid biosynthesis glycosyltransferase TuaC